MGTLMDSVHLAPCDMDAVYLAPCEIFGGFGCLDSGFRLGAHVVVFSMLPLRHRVLLAVLLSWMTRRDVGRHCALRRINRRWRLWILLTSIEKYVFKVSTLPPCG